MLSLDSFEVDAESTEKLSLTVALFYFVLKHFIIKSIRYSYFTTFSLSPVNMLPGGTLRIAFGSFSMSGSKARFVVPYLK